jgi:hypothetical protein
MMLRSLANWLVAGKRRKSSQLRTKHDPGLFMSGVATDGLVAFSVSVP